MGRKKSYNREDLIEKARELFRDHGYAGTSAEMLVEALGVNRYGIYAEFGSKQGLFEAALQSYDDTIINRNFGPMEMPEAGLQEIRLLFDFFAKASRGPASGRGCLLCNTAVEFGPEDPGGAGFVKRYFRRIESAFRNALSNAASQGELPQSVNLASEASFFTSSLLGLFVLLRAKAPATIVEGAASVSIEHLDSLIDAPSHS